MTKTFAVTGFIALLALAGCNTVAGVGEDVQAGGTAIESTATNVKNKAYTY